MFEKIKEQIEREAYQIWKRRIVEEEIQGCKLGDKLSDWLRAEKIVQERICST